MERLRVECFCVGHEDWEGTTDGDMDGDGDGDGVAIKSRIAKKFAMAT